MRGWAPELSPLPCRGGLEAESRPLLLELLWRECLTLEVMFLVIVFTFHLLSVFQPRQGHSCHFVLKDLVNWNLSFSVLTLWCAVPSVCVWLCCVCHTLSHGLLGLCRPKPDPKCNTTSQGPPLITCGNADFYTWLLSCSGHGEECDPFAQKHWWSVRWWPMRARSKLPCLRWWWASDHWEQLRRAAGLIM